MHWLALCCLTQQHITDTLQLLSLFCLMTVQHSLIWLSNNWYTNGHLSSLQCFDVPRLQSTFLSTFFEFFCVQVNLKAEFVGHQFYIFCIWLVLTSCSLKMLHQFTLQSTGYRSTTVSPALITIDITLCLLVSENTNV